MNKKKKRLLVVSILIFGILIISAYFIFFYEEPVTSCNDGTKFSRCSDIKPYFCDEGILVEKASVCGCFNLSEVDNDKCNSEYQSGKKSINLKYVLDGEEGEINFTVYKKIYDYVSEIPRFVNSNLKQPTLLDFKLRSIEEPIQREFLLPLVVEIQNLAKKQDDQARIAISIVQNIPFGSSGKIFRIGTFELEYYRYPYEVIYENKGVCGEKSELLTFLLNEIGYETAFLYYVDENHEAVGIKCDKEKSVYNSGYCFVETTGPAIITDDKTDYIVFGSLSSNPEITSIDGGISFGDKNFYEYKDAQTLEKIRKSVREEGVVNFIQHFQFRNLVKKYGLKTFEYKF